MNVQPVRAARAIRERVSNLLFHGFLTCCFAFFRGAGGAQSEIKQELTELTERGQKSLSVDSVPSCLNSLTAFSVAWILRSRFAADPTQSGLLRLNPAQSGSIRLNKKKYYCGAWLKFRQDLQDEHGRVFKCQLSVFKLRCIFFAPSHHDAWVQST